MKQGDVILEVNGQKVTDNNDLLKKIAGLTPGDKPSLTLWRNGKRITRTVELGQRGEQTMAAMKPQAPKASSVLGMDLKPVNGQEAKALGLDKTQGLLVLKVDQDSAASGEDIRQGDVIIQANQQDVNSVAELKDVLDRDMKRGAVMLLIKRQGQNRFVALPLETK